MKCSWLSAVALVGVMVFGSPGRSGSARAQAAPAGDTQGDALPIALPWDPGAIDVSAAGGEETDPFFRGGAPTLWLAYSAAVDGPMRVDTNGYLEHVLIAFEVQAPDAELSEGDAVAAGYDTVTIDAKAGRSYRIVLANLAGAPEVHLTADLVTPPPPPANDELAAATTVASLPFIDANDASGATRNPGDPGISALFPTVWYHVVLAESAMVDVAVDGTEALISVLTADGSTFAEGQGQVSFVAAAGVGYDVEVVLMRRPGPFTLTVDGTSLGGLAMDEASGAAPVTLPYESGPIDVTAATPSPEDPFFYGQATSVWFAYDAPADGAVRFDASGDDQQHVLVAFRRPAPGEPLTDADAVAAGYDAVILRASADTSYLIVVVAFAPMSLLEVSANAVDLPPPPANDHRESATIIDELPYDVTIDVAGATGDASDPDSGYLFATVWYRVISSYDQEVMFDTLDSHLGLQVQVFDANGGLVGFGNDRATFNASANASYDVLVMFLSPPTTLRTLVWGTQSVAKPGHDEIENAHLFFNLPGHSEHDVAGATANPTDPPESQGRPTVWYGIVAQRAGRLEIDASASDGDVELVLYDIAEPEAVFSTSRLTFLASSHGTLAWDNPGGHIYVVMAIPQGATHLDLRADVVEVVAPPPNDDIANAVTLDSAALPADFWVDTRGSSLGDDALVVPNSNTSIWYRITPHAPLSLMLAADGTPFGLNFTVYDGLPTSATSATDGSYRLLAQMAAGRTYYIGVTSLTRGSVHVTATAQPLAPNDTSTGATVIGALPYQAQVQVASLTQDGDDPTVPGGTFPFLRGTGWYTFTPTHDLDFAMGTSGGGTLALYTGQAGAWSFVAASGSAVADSVDHVRLTGGVTYTIVLTSVATGPGNVSVAFAEGTSVRAQVTGTVRWGQFVARGGSVQLYGPAWVKVPLVVAPDGLSGTFSAELPLAGTYTALADIDDCETPGSCNYVDWQTVPPTVHAAGSFRINADQYCVSTVGQASTCTISPPEGEGLALGCGAVDVGERGPTAWVTTSWSRGRLSGNETAAVGADGTYCVHLPQGATMTMSVTSYPTECTLEAFQRTRNVDVAVPAGTEHVTLPLVSFADGGVGALDVTTGIRDEVLHQSLSVLCEGDDCAAGCNAAGGADLTSVGEITQSHLTLNAGDKVVTWFGVNVPIGQDALGAILGGDINELAQHEAEFEAYFDALGSISAYSVEALATVTADGITPLDLSADRVAHLTAPAAVSNYAGHGLEIAVISVGLTSDEDPGVARLAVAQSLSMHGMQDLLQTAGAGNGVPPELLDFDMDVDPKAIDLALPVGHDWRLRSLSSTTVSIPDLRTIVGPDGESELVALELHVHADVLGAGDDAIPFIGFLGFDSFLPTDMGQSELDLPLGPLTDGEVRALDVPVLSADAGRLSLHVPAQDDGEPVTGLLLFVPRTEFDMPGRPQRVGVRLGLRAGREPFDQLSVELPAGRHFGLGVLIDVDGNLIGGTFGGGDAFDPENGNLDVEIADGDAIDQTAGAPVTHDLEPKPQETCATAIDFRGVVTDPDGVTEVKVDGQPVSLAADGSFSVHVDLAVGPNVITLDARDALGEWVSRTRVITRRAPHDGDGDGLTDCEEADLAAGGECPSAESFDTDGDGVSDGLEVGTCASACAADSDNDGLDDGDEAALGTSPCALDTDGDGQSDLVDPEPLVSDLDQDGVADDDDLCPTVADPDQVDTDDDGFGDACDDDDDGDGVADGSDRCPDSGEVVVEPATGCSIDALCPCAGPNDDEDWRNHGKYVACVKDAAQSFKRQGLIDEPTRREIVEAAEESRCGSPVCAGRTLGHQAPSVAPYLTVSLDDFRRWGAQAPTAPRLFAGTTELFPGADGQYVVPFVDAQGKVIVDALTPNKVKQSSLPRGAFVVLRQGKGKFALGLAGFFASGDRVALQATVQAVRGERATERNIDVERQGDGQWEAGYPGQDEFVSDAQRLVLHTTVGRGQDLLRGRLCN